MKLRWTLAVFALMSTPAFALVPSQHIYQGIEPRRIYPSDPASQFRAATAHSGWQRFLATDGNGWQARFDLRLGSPLRMWGPGIDLGPISNSTEVETALSAFLDAHPTLLGVQPREWGFHSTRYSPETNTWYVDIDVLRGGAPLWRAGITARIKFGKLIALGAASYADIPVINSVAISSLNAIQTAISEGPAPDASHEDIQTQLITLPEEVDGVVTLRLCWLVSSKTDSPVGQWNSFIDAQTGDLISVYNAVRFIEGTVSAQHDIRAPDFGTTSSSLPWVRIDSTDGVSYADENGYFSLPNEIGPITTFLRGTYLRVNNQESENAEISTNGSFQWTEDSASIGEIDAYVFLHQIRAWGASVAPDNEMVTTELVANVNINDVCNAYFDGNVNFFRSGSGCHNSARNRDVVHHEWGHGLHYYSILSGSFDGSLSEGAADFTAVLQTRDPVVGPNFTTNGDYIRNVAPNKVYPEDLTGEVHDEGLIFGGAMWDTWGLMEERLGEAEATTQITHTFFGLLKGGPTIDTSYDEAIIADDDDGDLGNGTPNFCELIEGFGQHGLGPLANGGSIVRIEHNGAPTLAESTVPLTGTVYNVAAACMTFAPDAVVLHYRVDGGDWQSIDGTVNAEQIIASLPELPLGSFVEYWFETTGVDDTILLSPASGSIAPFTTYIGDVLTIRCEDFEEDDGGFQHELLDGGNNLGADDWQWGAPMGQGGDPAAAWSGTHVWGNDLGDGDYNGEYQANITNRLSSPEWNTGYYSDVFFGYRRWLTVEDGQFDQARVLVNGQEAWSSYVSDEGDQHTLDDQWAQHVVPIGDTEGETVKLSWEISSDEGLQMGGWNIDDVCLYVPATPENQLQIRDFTATDEKDPITLSWTQPVFAPVSRVVVVRNAEGYPADFDDGDIIYDSTTIELGQPVTVVDAERGSFYYAVFASNGEDWYPSAVPGVNADIGSTLTKGCGCNTGTASWIGSLGLVGWLLGRRRLRS